MKLRQLRLPVTPSMMKSTIMKKFALFSLALAIAGMAGCKSSGGPANGLSTKNTVVWYIPSDVESINPILSSDEGANYVEGHIYERLSSGNPRTQAFIAGLAALPEESADHLTWTFTMDPTARWSDGKPVTAEDVIFTYKIVNNPFIVNAAPVRGYFVNMDSCWIPADKPTQVVFHWNKYRFDLLKITNYVSIMPKHIWDPANITDHINWADLKKDNPSNPAVKEMADKFVDPTTQRDPGHMIGSGPYKFEGWLTNDRITLRRDTNYWMRNRPWGDAYVDQITFKTIKDPNAALIALKHQDIDIDPSLTPSQYISGIDSAQAKNIMRDTIYENVYRYIGWNDARPMFSDKNVRKALTMLVDRDKIIHSILHDLTKKIDGPVAPTQPNYDPTVKQPGYDPTAAKALLAEAGWTDHDGDGILDKVIGGKKTDFSFTFLIPSGSDVPKQIMLVIANDLQKVGIKAEITQLEASVYLNNIRNRKFDAFYGGWVGNMSGSEGLEDEIGQLWESSEMKKGGSNSYAYSNPEADRIMEAIKIEPDRAKRLDLSHQLQHIIVGDQPVSFLWSSPQLIAWQDRFDNFEFFPTRPPFEPQYWIVRGSGIKRMPNGVPMSLPHKTDVAQP